MTKVLVVGANGQLGNELRSVLDGAAEYIDRDGLDITDLAAVRAFAVPEKYSAIVNCAAYTAVDAAENDADAAYQVNALGAENLAKCGLPMVHISTDYVFDGENFRPYVETDAPRPQSVYGMTKLAGEQAVLAHSSACAIVRTSWLYSSFGGNFVKTMLRLGRERDTLNVVFDQIGTPTYAADLARAIAGAVLPKLEVSGGKEIYHFSNEGVCSWYDFAVEIMAQAGVPCRVAPIESKDYPTAAKRPMYSVLNKAKIKRDLGIEIRHWKAALGECLSLIL